MLTFGLLNITHDIVISKSYSEIGKRMPVALYDFIGQILSLHTAKRIIQKRLFEAYVFEM